MPLLDRFRQSLAEFGLRESGTPVVVGASGGLDSTVLLDLLCASELRPVAAHVDYGLRGASSDGDRAFVRSLCAEAGVPCFVHQAELSGTNVQAQARAIRYRFFGDVADEVGASVVATAHHRDDQAETLLLNLFRGAGPVGLTGMPPRRPLVSGSSVTIIRPLLWARRADLEAYARSRDLRWREDASNRSADYRRNVVRREILPLIEQHFGGASDRMAQAASLLREYLDSGAALASDTAFDAVAESFEAYPALQVDRLAAHAEAVRWGLWLEALRRWAPDAPRTSAAARELDALLGAQPGRRVAWPSVTVWRERSFAVFVPADDAENVVGCDVSMGDTRTSWGTLCIEPLAEVSTDFDASPDVEVVDADKLRWPLRLRTWQQGDALHPVGLGGRKKVSDLLTERKVPSYRRARELVLLSGGEVVWAVGHRLDACAAVGPETRQAIRLVWNPKEVLAPDDEGR